MSWRSPSGRCLSWLTWFAIDIPLEVDFLGLSRFGEGGRIRIALDTAESVEGRDVVIVEDIIDTGLTLTVLRRMLEDRGAASVATAALVDKTRRRLVDVPIEYRGFEVGDEYLIGYGLDWKGTTAISTALGGLGHGASDGDPAAPTSSTVRRRRRLTSADNL